MKRVSTSLMLGLALISWAGPASAGNGAAPSIIGSKGPVSIPVDGDAMTALRMPSSIGWSTHNRVDVDLFLFFSRTELTNSLNDFDSTGSTPGGSVGFVYAPGRPDFDADEDLYDDWSPANRFTLHIGEYVEFAGGSDESDVRSTAFPDTKGVSTGVLFLTTAVTGAYTPTEWLSLGISANIIYAQLDIKALAGGNDTPLNGSPQIGGVPLPGNPTYQDFLEIFSSSNVSDPTTFLESTIDTVQFTGTFSVSVRPLENLGFGLAYTPRSFGPDFEGDADVDATRTFDQALGGLDGAIRDLFLSTLPDGGNAGFTSNYDITLKGIRAPRRIRGSIAYWPIPNLLFGVEVAWIEWHRAFRRADVSLKNGSNNDLNFVSGSNNIDTKLSLRMRNQFVYSFYVSYGVTDDITVRAGINYGESPLNIDQTDNSPSAGFVSTNISAGVGYRILPSLEVNFLIEYGLPAEETSDNSVESLTGKNSRYTSEQLFIHLGVGFRF